MQQLKDTEGEKDALGVDCAEVRVCVALECRLTDGGCLSVLPKASGDYRWLEFQIRHRIGELGNWAEPTRPKTQRDLSLTLACFCSDKVQALSYAQHTRQLISCGGDGGIVVWNMDVERQETPEWLDSDSCQKCNQPFFWNFKQMWDNKKIGLRQHHCRKCGKAVCGKCSSKRSSIPLMGFEFEVRVCDSCHEAITDEERAPTATFHDSKHNIVHVHFDATRGWLLTSGTDKVIKVGRHLLLEAFHLWSYANIQEPQDCVRSAHKVTLSSEHF
ncbi:hypothetical protein GH733_006683 [Mirounga leonina]|nr:hypothetical protein GH733_006683 [Mirounga leonina]